MVQTSLHSLDTLSPGDKGVIKEFSNDHEITERLREIGFSEDFRVEVINESLFGRDPMVVQVEQMTIALRRKDASHIIIAVSK
ncbi:FeoA family protein [Temperatibacter marinus]|uniref:FeoA family protein n=1 Tax=Temperatibacter marinus TaxID=1456591 RepID=A0AA52H7V1_9PROT|nr:FeoA family protein [Temperatibacter marinus]WND01461.1 FeoA family protein [Temperatibacter marinus]